MHDLLRRFSAEQTYEPICPAELLCLQLKKVTGDQPHRVPSSQVVPPS